MERDLVIIGHGMASQRRLLEALVGTDHPWRITVIGAEPERAYNRILLSPLLGGEAPESSCRSLVTTGTSVTVSSCTPAMVPGPLIGRSAVVVTAGGVVSTMTAW